MHAGAGRRQVVHDRHRTLHGVAVPPDEPVPCTGYQGRRSAQSVSKHKILRFWGVTLPLAECHEAHTERSGASTSTLCDDCASFDTLWASFRHSTAALKLLTIIAP